MIMRTISLTNFYWIVLPFIPFDLVLQFFTVKVKIPCMAGIMI